MIFLLFIVIIALIACIFLLERQHANERRDLYNRIMSKNYPEYKSLDVPNSNRKKKPNNYFKQGIIDAYTQQQNQNSPE